MSDALAPSPYLAHSSLGRGEQDSNLPSYSPLPNEERMGEGEGPGVRAYFAALIALLGS